MASSFCASLALAWGIVLAFGVLPGLYIALRSTARFAFLLFLPAYVGGPLVSLFGSAFSPLKERARDFGLAFAAAMLVHLGLVVSLCLIGHVPPAKTFAIFGLAALCTYVLALLSFHRVRQLLPSKFWPPIRALATNYIALAFLDDFKYPIGDFGHTVAYLPFAALAVVGVILRLVAWAQTSGRAPRIIRIWRQST
jgi:hypothetical protein